MNISSLLQGIASFAWIGFIGILIAISVRASRKQSVGGLSTAAIVLVVAALLLTTIGAGIVFIEPDELGVVVTVLGSAGIRPEPLDSGLHWIVPFIDALSINAGSDTDMGWRHFLQMNALFADGHVKLVKKGSPSINGWSPGDVIYYWQDGEPHTR